MSRVWIAVAVALALLVGAGDLAPAHADCASGRYYKYRHESLSNDPPYAWGGLITVYCCRNGLGQGGCGAAEGGYCPNVVSVKKDEYRCDGTKTGNVYLTGAPYCPCASGPPPGSAQLSEYADDTIIPPTPPATYDCPQNCPIAQDDAPQFCDGKEPTLQGARIDEDCGDDEHSCTRSQGLDGFPVHLASGRIETRPITLYALPPPEGIELDYTLKFDSHVTNVPALARTIGGVTDPHPSIHDSQEEVHYLTRGWKDSFSDRLLVVARGLDTSTITWTSLRGTVTFTGAGTVRPSTSGKFELVDRGTNPGDGLGRWIVRTTDTQAPIQIWTFEELVYATELGGNERIGRLRRRAVSGSSTSYTGYFGFTIDWATNGTITKVSDSLGRELLFTYTAAPAGCSGTGCKFRVPTQIDVRPASGASTYPVARLFYSAESRQLERVERVDTGGYTRFLYWVPPFSPTCANCANLVTDVIVPGAGMVGTPGAQAPIASNEIVLEHHAYEILTGGTADERRPRATESGGPGRHYAYVWDEANSSGVQVDLHQPSGFCSSGCPAGTACYGTTCYVAQQLGWGSSLRLLTQNHPFGATSSAGSGHPRSVNMSFAATTGAPVRATDPAGVKTTNGFDSKGRLRCIVRGDDDDEAFATPGSPDTSACAGPATAQIVRVDYAGLTITKTTPGLLGSTVTEVTTLSASTLLPVSVAITGTTRNIDGSPVVVTRTSTRSYDGFGRLVETNGPLPDGTALDKTTYAYHTVFNAGKPHDFGRLASVTRYVGTSSSSVALTTTYSDYDLHGAPTKVTQPSGEHVVATPSSDRLTWTIQQFAAGPSLIGTSTVVLNRDGTVRSATAADGVCLTYQYTGSNGFVGVPTAIRRGNVSDNQCGVVPINTALGEVEVRAYVSGEADRLQSITRYFNGVSQFSYSGFTYDRDRRLVAASTLDSATPFTFGFTDVLPSSTVAPGAPAAGSWRTDTTADDFGRPTSLARFITAANKQTYTYSYASPFSPRPTQLARGFNGSSTSITTFVYDDFGRLVETVVPESGPPGSPSPTRYEYDVADRLLKKRVGVGSAAVRTSVYSYDSLGRTLAVDHDTEHPVSCASAPDGTPIQDEEYRYDSCTGDVPAGFACANALGRLTISRAVLQCSSGQVVKRGRWFDYDAAGRLSRVAYATVTGTTIGAPAISTSTYSNAHRLLSVTNPITPIYGTAYTLDPASGRPTALTTSAATPAPIASNLTYRAFGALTGLDTPVTQPVSGGGTRTLQMRASYRTDNALETLTWRLKGTTDILLLSQTMAYGPAGLLTQRTDAADIASSRHYGYDSLLRLTCEARGLSGTSVQPSASDCVPSSNRLAGLFTYGDGQSATSPPDVRLTAFIKNAGTSGASYTSPSVETYTYSSGSGQTQQIDRTGSTIVLGYDLLGRRTFDYDSTQPSSSRRDYTYLPNGQLGSITGTASDGQYTISIRYDEEGHPLTLSREVLKVGVTDTHELFWDDEHRLIGAIVMSYTTGASQKWHYHYLGNTLVAGTRHLYTGGINQGTVKRFWMVSDERGLPYRWIDEQGATFWQARWDASGWRQIIGSPQANMWTAFALAGQLLLGGTGAGSTSTSTRPELALNHARAFDPAGAWFLQPDEADHIGRTAPEAYVYGRNAPTLYSDHDGRQSQPSGVAVLDWILSRNYYDISFAGCNAQEQSKIVRAVNSAVLQVWACNTHACSAPFTPDLQKRWLLALQLGRHYVCLKQPANTPVKYVWNDALGTSRVLLNTSIDNEIHLDTGSVDSSGRIVTIKALAATSTDRVDMRQTILSPAAFSYGCLSEIVAHEALHQPLYSMWPGELITNDHLPTKRTSHTYSDPVPEPSKTAADYADSQYGGQFGHGLIVPATKACVTCK